MRKQLVAWQEISAEVPENWTVGAISAGERSGYLRLDDREMPRLEVKWEYAPKGSDPDLVVKRFLNMLKKGKKGQKAEEVRRGFPLIPEREERKTLCFSWSGNFKGYGVAWFCRECRRAVMAQVLGKADQHGLQELAKEVLSSLRDHPDGDENVWSIYGLTVTVPSDWRLRGFRFLTGYINLKFGKGGQSVTIHRWAMAEYLLSEKDLHDFLMERGAKSLRKVELKEEPVAIKGHEGLKVEVTPYRGEEDKGRWRWVKWLIWGRPPKGENRRLSCVIWHCEGSDRIYVVEMRGRDEAEELMWRIARLVRCHE